MDVDNAEKGPYVRDAVSHQRHRSQLMFSVLAVRNASLACLSIAAISLMPATGFAQLHGATEAAQASADPTYNCQDLRQKDGGRKNPDSKA